MKRSISLLFIGSLFLIVFTIGLLIQPILFYDIDLTRSGQIGDMIGGVAAPIVGILGAVLVFLSFRAQTEANNIQKNALTKQLVMLKDEIQISRNGNELDVILRLFDNVQKYYDELKYDEYSGRMAYSQIAHAITHNKFALSVESESYSAFKTVEFITVQLYSISMKLLDESLPIQVKYPIAYQFYWYCTNNVKKYNETIYDSWINVSNVFNLNPAFFKLNNNIDQIYQMGREYSEAPMG